MKVLTSSKVARNGVRAAGRISLSPSVLRAMDIQLGDIVMIVEDQGRFFLKKVTADAE